LLLDGNCTGRKSLFEAMPGALQVALTLGTVVFGIYVATKVWSKPAADGRYLSPSTTLYWMMRNQGLHGNLQMQLGSRVAYSPGSSDSHPDKMMMVFLMYGLRANQSAKTPESLRRIPSGDLV
jgi:hypothetical protein